MAIHALKFQTHNFIRSMCDDVSTCVLSHHSLTVSVTNRVLLFQFSQGLVNEQFVNLEASREHPLRRDALVRAVTAYSLASKSLFSDITIQLEQEQVDFEKVSDLARDLYNRSSSIGAQSVTRACVELVQASDRKNKHYCSLALYWTKNRFSCLRSKFETLVKVHQYHFSFGFRDGLNAVSFSSVSNWGFSWLFYV
ncbi:hypothetical protein VNO80_24914 [Phaseolus coccineus]|uniref:Histidine-containing phosphotransfer protein n=1 Tax=Phaseolus coccineus TaxID=3886 RepID=A0AAN9QST8_PHACN